MTNPWIKMPAPPQGKVWCVACVAFAKAKINDEYGPQMVQLANDGQEGDFWFEPRALHLEPATVRGLCGQLQQLGLVELCWTHVAGIAVQQISPLDPQYQQGVPVPPGLLRGR